MGLPSKIKKHIPLTEPKTLLPRREEHLEKIVFERLKLVTVLEKYIAPPPP